MNLIMRIQFANAVKRSATLITNEILLIRVAQHMRSNVVLGPVTFVANVTSISLTTGMRLLMLIQITLVLIGLSTSRTIEDFPILVAILFMRFRMSFGSMVQHRTPRQKGDVAEITAGVSC